MVFFARENSKNSLSHCSHHEEFHLRNLLTSLMLCACVALVGCGGDKDLNKDLKPVDKTAPKPSAAGAGAGAGGNATVGPAK